MSEVQAPYMNSSAVKEQDYYQIDRMSNSALSNFKRSPRHYLYHKAIKVEPTPAMVFGSAFHCWVLENEKFWEQFFLLDNSKRTEPDKAMNSKLNIAWKAQVMAANSHKSMIEPEDLEKIKRMHDALMKHEPAAELINQIGEVEVPLFWKDDVTGIEMKGKMDGAHDEFTIDLKTCLNAQPESFSIDAYNNAYHRQAALYMDGRSANKRNKGEFYFIAIEKEQPYGVSVMKCAQDFIRHGRQVYGGLLEDVRYWREMGSPDVGYEWRSPFGYHDLNLPAWIK